MRLAQSGTLTAGKEGNVGRKKEAAIAAMPRSALGKKPLVAPEYGKVIFSEHNIAGRYD